MVQRTANKINGRAKIQKKKKNVLNTAQHHPLCNKLPFTKNECGVQVQTKKAWISVWHLSEREDVAWQQGAT